MNRTFAEHTLRQTRNLDGLWDFAIDPQDMGQQLGWQSQFPAGHDRMHVPACWNNELPYYDYRGAAWYRTAVTLTEAQNLRVIFHAVLGFADVYWDGEHVAEHFGGYTPFEFIVKQAGAGVHEIIVRTDNRLDEQTLPYHAVDWFHYGGIIRSVELQALPEVYIEGIKTDYTQNEAGGIEAAFEVRLRSLGSDACTVPLQLLFDNEPTGTAQAAVNAGGQTTVTLTASIAKPRLWNIGEPELYSIYVRTGNDDLADRIGFRFVTTKHKRILLNGKELNLQGVNRHEEHPEWGFAFPQKLMMKDLAIIKELGCNAVRGSHYPPSRYWLDLMDENGLVYWSEIPIWGAHTPAAALGHPMVEERALTMMEEMIRRDYHHPSILFWSVHNEIDTRSQEAYKLSVALTGLVRRLDTSRLVSYATMHPLHDIVMPLFDIIGINKYYGWYEGATEGFAGMLEAFHARAESLGCGDTPVLMTEFGGAGIHGDTGWEPRLFSEDYQADILATCLRIFRNDPKLSGTFIWQFADIRGDLRSDRGYFRDRARSFNNKGLVNEYRKPKQAFRVVRDIYRGDRYPL
ncbi:MAG: beta-glucuronidase [Paenibacillaceae bacterium]|jgi:beta-glucuronidase|nr:beta-glucuronidase [Paenibacillaceae bacterium]